MSKHTTRISFEEAKRGALLFVQLFPTAGFKVRPFPAGDSWHARHEWAAANARVLYVPDPVKLRSVAYELAIIVGAACTDDSIWRRPSGGFRSTSARHNILEKHARMLLTQVMRGECVATDAPR